MKNKNWHQSIVLMIVLFCFSAVGNAQILPTDSTFNKKKFSYVVGSGAILGAASVAYLYNAWYAKYPKSSFHYFNDGKAWLQMDKIGHATTAYFGGKIGYDMLRFAGVSEKKALWFGGSVGFAYLSLIEIMDGYSKEWGFSSSDMLANGMGAALFISQQALWNDQRISMKYSFHSSKYSSMRPDLLGSNFLETLIKDYNGQTYWLSANIYSFLPSESRFPKFINLAIGYSGDGLLGSFSNPILINGVTTQNIQRQRQYLLSLDIDLRKIKVRNTYLKAFFEVFSFVKVPFPALILQDGKMQMHPFYF